MILVRNIPLGGYEKSEYYHRIRSKHQEPEYPLPIVRFFLTRSIRSVINFVVMVQMQGLSLEQLADLYDASSDEEKQWMHDNISQWGKEKPE